MDTAEPVFGDGAIRRPSLYGSLRENTFAGVLSFMRRKYTHDLTGVDLAITGIPLDIATTFRPGARLGPRAMRAASAQLGTLLPYPWGVNPFNDYAVIDYGDCWLDVRAATRSATSNVSCGNMDNTRSAKKLSAPTSGNASAKARRPS